MTIQSDTLSQVVEISDRMDLFMLNVILSKSSNNQLNATNLIVSTLEPQPTTLVSSKGVDLMLVGSIGGGSLLLLIFLCVCFCKKKNRIVSGDDFYTGNQKLYTFNLEQNHIPFEDL